MTDDVDELRRARERVLGAIADACARAGRSPSGVTLVAVSKTVPAERVAAAVRAGFSVLGENRVQELAGKRPEVLAATPVGVTPATWHLIGPLQSNKARRAVETADVIQSVDSLDLARRLDRIVREVRGLPESGPVDAAARFPVLVQVNVDEDPAKAGFQPADLDAAAGEIAALAALDVRGLMTIGRLTTSAAETRATFRGLRAVQERLRLAVPAVGPELSMGMSGDFEIAVEEGSTIVRVGRAIFGDRPAPPA